MPTTPNVNLNCYFPTEPPFFTQIYAESDNTVKYVLEKFHKKLKNEGYDIELRDLTLYKVCLPPS